MALLFILYIAVAAAHAYLAPLTIGPDELAHYEYVNFIADHGHLPMDAAERSEASYKSDQPPLYHLLVALPVLLVDPTGPPYLKRVQDHPRRQLIERTRHAWGLYNTEDELWPYRGEVLRWHVGRWIAILFGVATVAVTYFIARELFAESRGAEEQGSRGAKEQGSRGAEGQQSGGETQSPISNLQSPISNPKLLALTTAAVVAFIPRFVLTGSMLNYETALAFFSALFLWALLRMASQSSKVAGSRVALRPTPYAPLLGLFAGLAITAKLSALILPLEIVIGLWLIGRYYGWPWQTWSRHVIIAVVTTLVAVSWWFGFVVYQFNTIAQEGLWVGLLRPLIAADSSDATTNRLLSLLTGGQAGFTGAIENLDSGPPWEWLAVFFRTFWVVGIEQQQPLGAGGLVIALGFCLLAVFGLWQWYKGAGEQGSRGAGEQGSRGARTLLTPHSSLLTHHSSLIKLLLSLLLLHFAAAFILPLTRYAVTFSLADTAQGRHVLFQTAPAFAILLIWGLSVVSDQLSIKSNQLSVSSNRSLPSVTHYALRTTQSAIPKGHYVRNSQFVLPLLPPLFLFAWTLTQLWTMTWAYNPLLPVQTVPRSQIEQPFNQPLNDYVTLLGFDIHFDPQNRVLQVDLLWESTAVSPVDYLTEITLLDSHGKPQAQWLGYPADGRYPTRAWDPGDTVRDTVWLPTGGLEAGEYRLSLNLVAATRNSQPENVSQRLESPVILDRVIVPDSTLRIFNQSLPFTGVAQAGGGYSVWQDGRPLDEPQLFRYRETVLVTLNPPLPGQQRTVELSGPDNRHYQPVRESDTAALFIVGPDWPTGEYRVEMTVTSDGQEQWASSDPVLQVIDRWERNFTEPPIAHRVEVNFVNQVELLGYDLPVNRANPGGGIPLTLYWQSLDWMGQNYTIFTKLLSAADQSVHGGRDRLPLEGYSTLYWAPGEIVIDPFGLPVDPNAPDGVYYINVGLYKEVNGQAVSLPLVQNGQPIETTSINIGPIKIGGPPPGVTLKQADPQVQLNQPFGDAPHLTLLGYTLTDESGSSISSSSISQSPNLQSLSLTLYWQSKEPLPTDYTTFVHLRNQAGETVAQKDQPPLNGAYPTSLWDPGEIIADEITLSLPEGLSAGEYRLVTGLYHFESGQRLSVPESPANEIVLTRASNP